MVGGREEGGRERRRRREGGEGWVGRGGRWEGEGGGVVVVVRTWNLTHVSVDTRQ